VVPLMISAGAGAEMRQTLGTAVFSGMLGVTLFGIFLTPVFYFVIQWASDKRAASRPRETEETADHPGEGPHGNGDGHANGDGHGSHQVLANGNGAAHPQSTTHIGH
jgi:multidrug efflux pump